MDDAALLPRALKVHAGDVEKLADKLFQPPGLVQGDAGVFGPLLRGEPRLVVEQVEVAQHRGQGRFEVVGQEGHQIAAPLFALPGGFLPFLEGPLDGVQVLRHRSQLLGQYHWLPALADHLAHRRADLVQPGGKAAQGQIEGDEHEHDGPQRQQTGLLVADRLLIQLQGGGFILPEQVLGHPQEGPGKGVLQDPVHHRVQQEHPHRQCRQGTCHHQQEHFPFQPGIALVHGRPPPSSCPSIISVCFRSVKTGKKAGPSV